MKMICDTKSLSDVIDVLNIKYFSKEEIQITGCRCIHFENGSFYFCEADDSPSQKFLLLELSDAAIWELDKFQSNLIFTKKRVKIAESRLVPDDIGECFIYVKRNCNYSDFEHNTVSNIKSYNNYKHQLNQCDIHLLIPGKLEKSDDLWDSLPTMESDAFDEFNAAISECIKSEYSSNFIEQISRKCIGIFTLAIKTYFSGDIYYQNALISIVKHQTGICVLEIMIPNCVICGNKLLNSYCSNMVHIQYQGKVLCIDDFLKELHIRKYGKKRSVVFAYGEITDDAIINALANEENPMAQIHGDFQRTVKEGNIAQYDSAQVYVSQETMFEKCSATNIFHDQRIAYQAIEIFFVELILFQDAAIDKVYSDIAIERERQEEHSNIKESIARCEEISFDMSQALHFTNFEQFNFPTVRLSANNIAKGFGIEKIFEKYERNKSILETLIQANKRREQEKQDNIKNKFLFLISAIATISSIAEMINSIAQDSTHATLFAYILALVIAGGAYGIYCIIISIAKHIENKKERR